MLVEVSKNVFGFFPSDESCSSYLLLGRKNVLVDTGLSRKGDALVRALLEVDLEPADINAILHTHGHADHFGADDRFSKALVYMHPIDEGYVTTKDRAFTCADRLGERAFPRITSGFSDRDVLRFSPFKLEVVHTPGHTRGSVCFFEKNMKLLFSGDTLFEGNAGRFDLRSGNKGDLLASLDHLLRLDFKLLFPGHGTVFQGDQKGNVKKAKEAVISSPGAGMI